MRAITPQAIAIRVRFMSFPVRRQRVRTGVPSAAGGFAPLYVSNARLATARWSAKEEGGRHSAGEAAKADHPLAKTKRDAHNRDSPVGARRRGGRGASNRFRRRASRDR